MDKSCKNSVLHRGGYRTFKGGGGGGVDHECRRRNFSRGVWEHALPEIFENLILLNGHVRPFQRNFVLV